LLANFFGDVAALEDVTASFNLPMLLLYVAAIEQLVPIFGGDATALDVVVASSYYPLLLLYVVASR